MVVSALMKLAGGAPTLAAELNVDAFLRQARSYDEASAGPLGWYLRQACHSLAEHELLCSENQVAPRRKLLSEGTGLRNCALGCAQECTNASSVPSLAGDEGSRNRPVVEEPPVQGSA